MATDLSYEREDLVFFSTTRTLNSKLWFVNNPRLQERMLAFLARYQEMFGVVIYAFIVMGNHYHLLAAFPRNNKKAFFTAFNAIIARLTNTYVREFEGGKLWGRRARSIPMGDHIDIKHQFFYTALNPVGASLTHRLSEYEGYNSWHDALTNKKRSFKIFLRQTYYNRKRRNPRTTKEQCTVTHTLAYSRLPGYEHLSQKDYLSMMIKELEERRVKLVEERSAAGQGFATPAKLREQRPGAKPRFTKTSKRNSKRPLILTRCAELKKQFLEWYFTMRQKYKLASLRYRSGVLDAEFPPGTYRPISFSPL